MVDDGPVRTPETGVRPVAYPPRQDALGALRVAGVFTTWTSPND
jgi:hypothetical protein